MKRRYMLLIILLLVVPIVITGCVPGYGRNTTNKPAGFFWGVWHGWIAPISLVIELFDKNIRIYEVHNSGWWYDFGFYIAVISGFGGISFFRKKKRKRL